MFLRFFQHTVIFFFLVLLTAGLSYTLFRAKVLLPWPLINFSYQSMAPYQGYGEAHEELIIEAKKVDGTWERLSEKKYFPYARGERFVRARLWTFRVYGDDVVAEKYNELAEKIYENEQRSRSSYEQIRLTLESWPTSPEGFEVRRKDPFRTFEHVAVYP